jgi:hypothetical protein
VKAVAVGLAIAATAGSTPPPSWHPAIADAIRYAQHRHGEIAFAVRTPGGAWGWHQTELFPSASVLKAMLLVAYLDLPSVQVRPLRPPDRTLLAPMIRRSDNAAAGRVLALVGPARLRALARRAGMRRFTPVTGIWGLSRIDAADQARYLLHVDELVAPRHRAYAMHGHADSALGHRARAAVRLAALLQGRLGLGHRVGRPPGGAPDTRRRTRLRRHPHPPRRQPRVRQGDAARDRPPPLGGAQPPVAEKCW